MKVGPLDFAEIVTRQILQLKETAKRAQDESVMFACGELLEMSSIISNNVRFEPDTRPIEQRYINRFVAVMRYNSSNQRLSSKTQTAYLNIMNQLNLVAE